MNQWKKYPKQPEEFHDVMVYVPHLARPVICYREQQGHGIYWWTDSYSEKQVGLCDNEELCYWMDLPEPPE